MGAFVCRCTRCQQSGFINLHQIPEDEMDAINEAPDFIEAVQAWMAANPDSDVSVCDCCGDGDEWYGEPGEHHTGEPCGCY